MMLDLTDGRGCHAAPTWPLTPDANCPGIDLSGAPDCLCVYRLSCPKSITLQKSARRAGLYPHTPRPVSKDADPPKAVRAGGLEVVDVERWRLRSAQEEDEE